MGTKLCKVCGLEKENVGFNGRVCRDCTRIWNTEYMRKRRQTPKQQEYEKEYHASEKFKEERTVGVDRHELECEIWINNIIC